MEKLLGENWKTTLVGILVILVGIASIILSWFGIISPEESDRTLRNLIPFALGAIGLLAKDFNK